jgi:hypothetical protein
MKSRRKSTQGKGTYKVVDNDSFLMIIGGGLLLIFFLFILFR